MRKNKSYNESILGQEGRVNFASVQDIKSEQSNYGQKEIVALFEKRFLGSWEETQYKVNRYYLESDNKCINLYVTKLTPKLPIATLIILHGFGEHSGRYMHLADEIAQQNIEVILYDQRGFGQSGGRRGHSTIEEMHIDLECIMKHTERSLPLFLYCHSLGAAVAISFCLANPTLNIQGLIAVNPYIQVAGKYSLIKRSIVHIMNFLIPGLMVNSYIDLAHCSKNNYNIRKVAQDNLISPFLSMQMAYNILQLSSYITPNLQQFVQPLLVIHGKEDKVAHHMNSIELYRHAGSKIKTLKIFDNGFHEPQNDVEFIRLKNYVTIWCQKQIQRDKRISYLKVLNHGIKQGSRTKFIIVQLILIYLGLRKQINKLGMIFKWMSIISLILASFVVNISW